MLLRQCSCPSVITQGSALSAHRPSLITHMRLNDKVALITGGTSGIGEATALLFAREGAEVAITGRNRQRGAQVVGRIKEVGAGAIFVHADVSSAGDCRRAVEETVEAFGRLDILF